MLPFLSFQFLRSRKLAFLVVVCLCFILSTLGLRAQNDVSSAANPTLTSTANDVNEAGYSLKPSGLALNEWPKLRFDFSIERADHTIFKNLSLNDVQAKVDQSSVSIREGDLKLSDTKGTGVLILLDGSGSMVGSGVDKLRAAKEALKVFFDTLGSNDRVGVIAFDEYTRIVTPITSDKEVLKRDIDAFTIRKDRSRFTRLYDAVVYGLEQAKDNQIKNLLIISDGWEDTPETRKLSSDELARFKQGREQQITTISRKEDVRVFTVAIGDEHGTGLSFVDRPSLSNISKGANGGDGAYIELTESSGEKAIQQHYLRSRLNETLAQLRQSFGYSYSLTLHVAEAEQPNASEHKLWLAFTVGDDPRVQLPVEYTYALTPAGPIVTSMKKQPAIFIQTAPRTLRWHQLSLIYVVILSALLVLTVIPAGIRRLVGGGQALRLNKAIMRVGPQSALVGSACPNEGTASGSSYLIKEGDVVLVCPNPDCGTPHHLSCWRFNDHHCMQRNCELEMVVPPDVLEKYGLMERQVN